MKVNIAEVLRLELARPSWRGEGVVIGAATDPYQPAEGRYRLTRALPRELGAARQPVRDHHARPADRARRRVLAEASRRADVSVAFSVPTIDDDVWRTTEPGPPRPASGCARCATLVDAGIRASVGMAPLLPGLSDHPSSLARVVAPRARPAPAASGRTSCTSSRARASTS